MDKAMTFRARMLLVLLPAVLLPMLALALIIRQEVTQRLTAQFDAQVYAEMASIQAELAEQSAKVALALRQIKTALAADNRFRRAFIEDTSRDRRYVLDYAEQAMDLAGLDVLQLQNNEGRILSSGHFRNEYDRVDAFLLRKMAGYAAVSQDTVLATIRVADGAITGLVRADSLQLGGRWLYVLGGIQIEQSFLNRLTTEGDITVALHTPRDTLQTSAKGRLRIRRERENTTDSQTAFSLPFIATQPANTTQATFVIRHDGAVLTALLAQVDQWFVVTGALAILLVAALVVGLSAYISKPLADLAYQTTRLDLHRLDMVFRTKRNDEIGVLAEALSALRTRLRTSVHRLKEAERRATTGELARQVNHDIKNGLIPIRNVLRHFRQVATSTPNELAAVYEQRQKTLDVSMGYLEDLAANYAELSPQIHLQPCDVNELLRRLAKDLGRPGISPIQTRLGRSTRVLADPIALRRILENIINNALDSLEKSTAKVTLITELIISDYDEQLVRITINDQGKGLSEVEKGRIFEDFYTTKTQGTGLGLSIVRRLVMDLGGSIRVENNQPHGSRFMIELPASLPTQT